jgi:hypothetical protein
VPIKGGFTFKYVFFLHNFFTLKKTPFFIGGGFVYFNKKQKLPPMRGGPPS